MKHPDRSISSRIWLWIDRIIRDRKTIAIGFVALLILGQLLLIRIQENKNTHYLKMMGSCNQATSVKIFDETGGIDPVSKMVEQLNNRHFTTYVNTISKHIFAKIDKMGQCRGNARENPQVDLVFVCRPAISSGIEPYHDSPTKFWNNRYLDSPWVKLSLDKSPQIKVRAVFIWNERQFLFDRAVIKAKRVSDTKPLLPIEFETFQEWALDYTRAEYSQRADIAKQLQLPADILWLFKYTNENNLWNRPHEVPMNGPIAIADGEKLGYTDLIETILDRFFAESKTDIRYNSILDLQAIFNIDNYRIYRFTNEEWFKHYKSLP